MVRLKSVLTLSVPGITDRNSARFAMATSLKQFLRLKEIQGRFKRESFVLDPVRGKKPAARNLRHEERCPIGMNLK